MCVCMQEYLFVHNVVSVGVGDSGSPHLSCFKGVEHLVFEQKPQPLPLPFALFASLQTATHSGSLCTHRYLHTPRLFNSEYNIPH